MAHDLQLERKLRTLIDQWQTDIVRLLPTAPHDIQIDFDNDYLVPGSGVGGAAYDRRIMKLAYDASFDADEVALLQELKASYFHESYHLARDFSIMTTPDDLPALHNAVEEGLATRFEMTHVGVEPGYAACEDRTTMLAWLEEVRGLPDGFDYEWQRWKFFDPATGRRWILYKTGLFVVDEVLRKCPGQTIDGLAETDINEIISMSGL